MVLREMTYLILLKTYLNHEVTKITSTVIRQRVVTT